MTVHPKRPVLRWHGGKWRLAPWIIKHFPAHRVYVEPFGGAASVLMQKPRAYAEIYGDLDGQVVNLFQVLRDEGLAEELTRRLKLTPFARSEFEFAQAEPTASDPVEQARRLIVISFMGFGAAGVTLGATTGFRANSNRSGTTPAHDWANYPQALAAMTERLRGVVVEKRPAVELMAAHDGGDTLHYVDPPYLSGTRSEKARKPGPEGQYLSYRHELTVADHVALLGALRGLKGMVVLSGYPSALYDDALSDWRRVTKAAHADGARPRTEVMWINPAAVARFDGALPLMAAAGASDG